MHVFFATDGSDSARSAQAQILALPWRSPVHVTVMTALPVPQPPLTSWIPAARQALDTAVIRLRHEAEARAREVLDEAHLAFEGKVASVGTRMHEGNPGVKIVEMARACRADLVAVGTRGLGTYKGVLLGSVSDYVANHARCSVLLARTPPGGRRRYLVALDDSDNAVSVVRWLGELDLSDGASIHLVKVFRSLKDFPFPDDEDDEDGNGHATADRFTAWNSSPKVLEALRAQGLGPPGSRVTVEIRFGHEVPEILASLRKFEPELLVIGAKGRNSHPDWPLGGVAQQLIDHAPCSALIVRP